MEHYKTLDKLYYGDSATYQDVYERRFNGDRAVHLDFTVAGHPAFFVQDDLVVQLMYHILRLDKEIAVLRCQLPPVALDQYTRKCLIDEVVLTNQIEGIHSSRKEIGDVLDELGKQSEHRGRRSRYDGIVKRYALLSKQEPLDLRTSEDVRRLYDELVLDEVLAEDPKNAPDGVLFRKDQAEVKNGADKVIHKGVYPEEAILDAMEKALTVLGDDRIDGLYRVCLFHYLLEYIHPFYDGNGRLGRFIVSEHLARTMDPLLGYRLSKVIKEDIGSYYKAFSTCNHVRDLGDLTPFLLMMLRMVAKSEEDLKDSLSRKVGLLRRYADYIPSLPGANRKDVERLYFLLIQAALFGEAGISTQELRVAFAAGYTKVKGLLSKVPPELLEARPLGRRMFYSLRVDRLPV